jgi:predicted KAP-like P-loop ATPase
MIENDEQLRQASEAIGDLYQAVASYRSRILPLNPRNYRVIAQGPLDEIRKIQADIDSYLGLRESTTTAETLRETPPERD